MLKAVMDLNLLSYLKEGLESPSPNGVSKLFSILGSHG